MKQSYGFGFIFSGSDLWDTNGEEAKVYFDCWLVTLGWYVVNLDILVVVEVQIENCKVSKSRILISQIFVKINSKLL